MVICHAIMFSSTLLWCIVRSHCKLCMHYAFRLFMVLEFFVLLLWFHLFGDIVAILWGKQSYEQAQNLCQCVSSSDISRLSIRIYILNRRDCIFTNLHWFHMSAIAIYVLFTHQTCMQCTSAHHSACIHWILSMRLEHSIRCTRICCVSVSLIVFVLDLSLCAFAHACLMLLMFVLPSFEFCVLHKTYCARAVHQSRNGLCLQWTNLMARLAFMNQQMSVKCITDPRLCVRSDPTVFRIQSS